MNGEIVWMMDSEFCCECGTGLNYWESDLCFDCQQDQWYDEDQDYYAGWDEDDYSRLSQEVESVAVYDESRGSSPLPRTCMEVVGNE